MNSYVWSNTLSIYAAENPRLWSSAYLTVCFNLQTLNLIDLTVEIMYIYYRGSSNDFAQIF